MQRENEHQKGIAVGYPRVSSDGQVEGTSLDMQEDAIKKYCERENLKLDKIFRGEGESAKLLKRPELQELLAYIRANKGKITHLVVYKFDRFSRNLDDHLWLRKELIKYGVTVKSVTEATDDTLAGRLQENILAVFNEYDNSLRADRSLNGMKEKVKTGIWPWPVPIGYKSAKRLAAKEKKVLPDVMDEDTFFLIRKSFDMYLTGDYSIAEVARKITELSAGKLKIRPQRMQYILSNKYYCGILVMPGSKGQEEHEGRHIPMIDENEYAQVQRIMHGKGRKIISKKWINPDFPLRGFIKCGNCSTPFTGSFSTARNKQKHPYYHCYRKDCEGIEGVASKSIPKSVLEGDFLDYLAMITPNKQYLNDFWKTVLNVAERKYNEVNAEYIRYDKRFKELQQYKNNLVKKNINGILPDEDFKDELAKVKAEIEMAELAMHEAKIDVFQEEAVLEYSRQFIHDLPRQWFDLGIEGKRRFQKLLFPEGLPYLGNGKFGTAKLCVVFEINQEFQKGKTSLVRPAGVEPTTPWSEARCSIH